MGIRDRRILQIIKAMLRAGIMDNCEVNEEGTQQGGLLSPLLANVYLDMMDEWVLKQWETKSTKHQYANVSTKNIALKKTALIPGYLVRYADDFVIDFVIVTDTRTHAESWKARLEEFLLNTMKLILSKEKTLITDARRKYIKFLGFQFKLVPGKAKKGYILRTLPDKDRLKRKVHEIAECIRKIPRHYSKEQLIGEIDRINSKIRGLINYYQCCTWVNVAMKKYANWLQRLAKRRLKQ